MGRIRILRNQIVSCGGVMFIGWVENGDGEPSQRRRGEIVSGLGGVFFVLGLHFFDNGVVLVIDRLLCFLSRQSYLSFFHEIC
jgi:hypothetical protein